jgi:hypothetical protein
LGPNEQIWSVVKRNRNSTSPPSGASNGRQGVYRRGCLGAPTNLAARFGGSVTDALPEQ